MAAYWVNPKAAPWVALTAATKGTSMAERSDNSMAVSTE